MSTFNFRLLTFYFLKLLLLFGFSLSCFNAVTFAQSSKETKSEGIPVLEYYDLGNRDFPIQWPSKKDFKTYSLQEPTLSPGRYLFQTSIGNHSNEDTVFLDLGFHRLKGISLQVIYANDRIVEYRTGMFVNLSKRKYPHRQLLFGIPIKKGEEVQCRIKLIVEEYFYLPAQLGSKEKIYNSIHSEDLVLTFFAGIFISMVLYNLFIYLTTRDRMYLVYVCYHFFMAYTQLALFGFTQEHIFGELPKFDYWAYMVSGSMVGTSGCIFVINFLHIKKYSAGIYKTIIVVASLFPLYLVLDLFGYYSAKELVYDLLGLSCIALFYISIYISIKNGNLQTKFLLVGWSLFMLGYICFILKNEGVLPYNLFTHYAMITGSALEMILLSFALAHRITTLRKDNEKKQQEIILQLETNEQFLRKSKQLELDKERLKKEILLSEYESLKKQINPHFLFNSLNVLSDLVNEEQELAETFVEQLAKVYRYILECEQESLVPMNTELDFIESFIFLLKIRFEENLHITIDTEHIQNQLIAPLTLQLLIENAVKHNVISSENPLRVKIYTEQGYIVVSNNMQLRRGMEKSTGKGLKNIKSRYKFISSKPVEVFNTSSEFIVRIPFVNQ
ncbi:MAG: histidine kinase [Sporocytophaga sp.]|uniref:7TM diverse intracellular signaling domain-containing protein n=1 Tax=Sporocytophaga sp. TaxID=2231183 RepID=UPI001B171A48|nr:7TM diverse intracellular signaling domain-containing protein [Sporocytophaga sp.]MBO9703004.1 histidine kinase [Sporocytophaga sp.]